MSSNIKWAQNDVPFHADVNKTLPRLMNKGIAV
jgi:hypothetical protein